MDEQQTDKKTDKKKLLAGVSGNLLEWFDFAVYGFFAVTIGKVFFPDDDPSLRSSPPSVSLPSVS